MKIVLLIIYFSLLTFVVFSQQGKDRLRDIVEEELEEDDFELNRASHSGLYQFTPAQQVPSWFINPPLSDAEFVYSIGISDPGLDSVQAFKMALYRAEIIANVLNKSTTQLLCDFFLDEQNHASNIVYENYSRIYANIPYNIDPYELVDSYYNEYHEAMVLIRYNTKAQNDLKKKDRIEMEVYKNETESGRYGNYESVYELLIKQDSMSTDAPLHYQLTELGKRNSVAIVFDSLALDVPIYTLKYHSLSTTDSTGVQFFSHGLWKEFYKALSTQIISVARTKPENVSALSDRYNTASYQKLTRGISQNKMRFTLTGVAADNNQLNVKLKELPLLTE